MAGVFTQMRPPKPAFTENNLGDLSGKVYIVTGANTGVGKELAKILYSKNATVYVGARSESKATEAINEIRAAHQNAKGRIEFYELDLADLKAVAQSAKAFIAKETSIDVVFCNAGVMHPPQGSKTAQGYELQQGVHNLGHQLLVELLTPLLAKTAAGYASPGGVRVVWVASMYAESSRKPGGFDPENIDYSKKDESKYYKYSASKAGMYYQGAEYARRHKAEGIISVTVNPGNLKSDLQRHWGTGLWQSALRNIILFHPINGAYSELFSGLSPDVALEKSGSYIIPWGRLASIRADLEEGTRSVSDGGSGMAEKWYEWCLEQIKPFLQEKE